MIFTYTIFMKYTFYTKSNNHNSSDDQILLLNPVTHFGYSWSQLLFLYYTLNSDCDGRVILCYLLVTADNKNHFLLLLVALCPD